MQSQLQGLQRARLQPEQGRCILKLQGLGGSVAFPVWDLPLCTVPGKTMLCVLILTLIAAHRLGMLGRVTRKDKDTWTHYNQLCTSWCTLLQVNPKCHVTSRAKKCAALVQDSGKLCSCQCSDLSLLLRDKIIIIIFKKSINRNELQGGGELKSCIVF